MLPIGEFRGFLARFVLISLGAVIGMLAIETFGNYDRISHLAQRCEEEGRMHSCLRYSARAVDEEDCSCIVRAGGAPVRITYPVERW